MKDQPLSRGFFDDPPESPRPPSPRQSRPGCPCPNGGAPDSTSAGPRRKRRRVGSPDDLLARVRGIRG